ncbi:winged helix-turn-helix transcriptional regulator [Cellvibrio fontiphilus]|jgi:DNA-binding HxlR family transcriptional regulator|uniref:Winged helix-turn-helix transcriptional regulator n=1 Tax=Cellvibrio fontiphilus TaxID=1815559 RepID=A0ABV7FH31_9GAMM
MMKNDSGSDSDNCPTGLREIMQRGNVMADKCPSRAILNHVTSRWGVLLLIALRGGTHRFSELRRRVTGISEKMLAQTLQTLEADGFVQRISYPVVPPHVEYLLTPMGEQISEKVEALADWIEMNLGDILKVQLEKAGSIATA